MTADRTPAEEISRQEGRGSSALWFGVLGAPVAWVLHMTIGYSFEEWFACSPSASSPGEILGIGVPTAALAITVAFSCIALGAGITALRCLQRTGKEGGETTTRARWMAIVGLMNSGLYLLIILGGLGPAFLLRVCETSP